MHQTLGTLLICLLSVTASANNIAFRDISLSEARQVAFRENKFLFIDFYAPWCAPCKQMEREVFSDKPVADYINANFIAIRINGDEHPQEMATYKVNAYPTLVFLDSKGKQVTRHEGALNSADFTALTGSVVNLNTYTERYNTTKTPENVFNYLNALVGHNLFQPGIFVLQLLKPFELINAHTSIFTSPIVKSGFADPMLAAYFRNFLILLRLFVEDPNNLGLGKANLFHLLFLLG